MNESTVSSFQYETIRVVPLIGALGAEIQGIDLTQPLSEQAATELRQAWLAYHVVVFRDQVITPRQQCDFARRFGELDTYPFVKPLEDYPEVIPVIKEADNKFNFGGGWHTDTSYPINSNKL